MSISVGEGTFHIIPSRDIFGICIFQLLKWENRHRNTCWGREVRDNNFRFGYSESLAFMGHLDGDIQ